MANLLSLGKMTGFRPNEAHTLMERRIFREIYAEILHANQFLVGYMMP